MRGREDFRNDLGVLEGPQLGQHEGEHGDGRDEEDHEGLQVGDRHHVGAAHQVGDGLAALGIGLGLGLGLGPGLGS